LAAEQAVFEGTVKGQGLCRDHLQRLQAARGQAARRPQSWQIIGCTEDQPHLV